MKLTFAAISIVVLMQACMSHQKLVKPKIAATAIEISSMAELESFVEHDSLVLFDLDHTVFEGAQVYGHAKWFYGCIEKGKLRGISPGETITHIFPNWLKSQERTTVKLVEPMTSELIKRLQNKSINVMGLTARQTPLINATLRQLSEIGVDFRGSSLMPAIFGINEFVKPVAFRDGILFTSEFVKKSQVLKAYFDRIAHMPRHIVFVDDSLSHVADIIETFEKMGVKVVGLHYPLVESRHTPWDQDYAEKLYAQCSKEAAEANGLCGKRS